MLVCTPEELIKVLASDSWKLAHEGTIIGILDLVNELGFWLTDQISNHHHLLLLCLSREERSSFDELSQDATNTPNVDSARVLAPRENYFGGAVPARGDVVGQDCWGSH